MNAIFYFQIVENAEYYIAVTMNANVAWGVIC